MDDMTLWRMEMKVDQAVMESTGFIISRSTEERGIEETLCIQSLEECRLFTLVSTWMGLEEVFIVGRFSNTGSSMKESLTSVGILLVNLLVLVVVVIVRVQNASDFNAKYMHAGTR
jgi:hypothetical protein